MENYQLWLQDRQKEILLEYIKDRRYSFMLLLYLALIISVVLNAVNLADLLTVRMYLILEPHLLVPWVVSTVGFMFLFFHGMGNIFWKNSDYDCLLNDKYQLDFLECAGKLPDSGKAPYFIKCTDENEYQWCMKFLEWKNTQTGDTLVCVTLKNGQKYALLPEKHS
ncbi:MAG: hypothetical protein E7496_04045 [Ruminococcus sp.]|nr:hypothetical protein [Ruminococcus sp.]